MLGEHWLLESFVFGRLGARPFWGLFVEVIVCMASCHLEPFVNLAVFFIVVVLGGRFVDYTFWVDVCRASCNKAV